MIRATIAKRLTDTGPPLTACLAKPVDVGGEGGLRFRAMKSLTLCALALTAVAGCSRETAPAAAPPPLFPAGELVDLSHAYGADTIFWPTAESFRLHKDAEGVTPAGYYYASNSFSMSEHGGTHLDAPVHFAQGHQSVDRIPLQRFFGPVVVVDVTKQSESNADYQVSVDDLTRAESDGAMTSETIVLLRTGFSRHWPNAATYLGTAERGAGAVPKLHFPGLHADAAKWLVAKGVRAVGIDTASIDYGQSTLFESHRILYAADLPAFENLTSLDRLPVRGAFIVALPMKIADGTGAPLRAVGILPK
jgi:kynurenine formamidase